MVMVRIAILGDGERAARHRAALDLLRDVEVVDIPDPASSDADIRTLLERPDLDLIDLAIPPGDAATTAIAAAPAGKRVIAEYTPRRSTDEADRVRRAVRDGGGSLSLLTPERYQPLPQELKSTLAAGKLGTLRYVHSAWIWHGQTNGPATQSGSGSTNGEVEEFVIDHVTPPLDMVAWLFDDVPVATLFARTCSLADDGFSCYVSVILSLADASQAVVEVGVNNRFPAGAGLRRLALTGLRGSAYFNERDHDLLISKSGSRPLTDESIPGLARAFSSLLDDGLAGPADAGLAFAAVESLRTGQPVEVR